MNNLLNRQHYFIVTIIGITLLLSWKSWPSVLENFTADAPLIHQYLDGLQESELHFFWTTGRTLSDNPAYDPDRSVEIGGPGYGERFFTNVDLLLKNSPAHLKVKFIGDELTFAANSERFSEVSRKYSDRFMLIRVEEVEDNLLQVFTAPDQQEKIKAIFKNATQGNPVSASDIYRVIGMMYAQNSEPSVDRKQYTYVDIDTFCHGVEHVDHSKLIRALFEYIPKEPFYFGKTERSNDLIKISIFDTNKFKEFCENIISKISLNESSNNYVLTYFAKLHDIIKTFEISPEKGQQDFLNLKPLSGSYKWMVIKSTGPDFLAAKEISTDLTYPEVFAGAWRSLVEKLNERPAQPNNMDIFDGGKRNQLFIDQANDYTKYFMPAFYAKKFGKNHPFNLFIADHLKTNFPYNHDYFKELLCADYSYASKDKQWPLELSLVAPSKQNKAEEGILYLGINNDSKLTYSILISKQMKTGTFDIEVPEDNELKFLRANRENILAKAAELGFVGKSKKGLSFNEWQDATWKRLTNSPGNHFATLKMLLEKLGIEVPFNKESLNDYASAITISEAEAVGTKPISFKRSCK
jgi:hypothetical protein